MGSPVAKGKLVKDGTPHCFCGREKDQVGEPQNLGQPTGRGLPALLLNFCQLDTTSGQLEEGPLVKELPSSSWPTGMSVGCFLD